MAGPASEPAACWHAYRREPVGPSGRLPARYRDRRRDFAGIVFAGGVTALLATTLPRRLQSGRNRRSPASIGNSCPDWVWPCVARHHLRSRSSCRSFYRLTGGWPRQRSSLLAGLHAKGCAPLLGRQPCTCHPSRWRSGSSALVCRQSKKHCPAALGARPAPSPRGAPASGSLPSVTWPAGWWKSGSTALPLARGGGRILSSARRRPRKRSCPRTIARLPD
jgi:hypothetical protein